MKRTLYIILFILATIHLAMAGETRKNVVIQWGQAELEGNLSDSGEEQYLLVFDGAVNHDRFGYLPVFFDQVPLEGFDNFVEISIERPVSQILDLDNKEISIIDAGLVPDKFTVHHETVIINKRPYLSVYLLPLSKDSQSGDISQLFSCELVIHIAPVENEARAVVPVTRHTENSVLSAGQWYKLAVSESGIYKITYDDLVSYGMNPSGIDPRKLALFGNGGRILPESTSQPRPDDLMENAIQVIGAEDGSFDEWDFILFYGDGPVHWTYNPFYQKYEHDINIYSDEAYYFLTEMDGTRLRIEFVHPVQATPDTIITHTDDFAYHESDSNNLIKSGKEWYGEVFNHEVIYDFDFHFPDLDKGKPAFFKANFVARSTENSNFTISYDNEYLGEQEIGSVQVGSAIFARTMTTRIIEFSPNDTVFRFTIEYSKPNNTSLGWLNYIQLNLVSHLRFSGGQEGFRNIRSVGAGKLTEFNIDTELAGVRVWDVTDPFHVTEQGTFYTQDGFGIRVATDSLREFIMFDATGYKAPEFAGKVQNQNLHGYKPANMVMVVHPPFMPEAMRLADFHRQYSQLSVQVVTPGQVYNEFSSGMQDVSAIRDFLKMLYDRNTDDNEIRYLLMFGDASYDYKDRIPEDNNLVPTFQSNESLKQASSFVTDDFFGCLDYGEGSNASGTVDLGIGRFPVMTIEEARVIVDKVIHYGTASRLVTGGWRNLICLVADDEDNNIHMGQAEELADIIDTTATGFNINKIYLDAYAQQQSPAGERYPDVNAAIDKTVLNGALIVNYTGHGGETGWAHEKVLDMPMILGWDNFDRLAAFVTATCEFSRFDDPALVSAGEWVLLNPKGGGIGLFTTTRLAYSQSNAALNKRFYQAAFERDSLTHEYPRMGDLMKASKTPSSQNIKNFVLLGDPALMLAYPHYYVKTLSINNEYSGKETDTLRALSQVTITGQIEDLQGNMMGNFNGILYPTILDKPVLYRTRANDPASKVKDFYIQNKALYKGGVTITNGTFSFSFIVPKDISYQFGLGKISYYALDTTTYADAQGFTEVYVGGADGLSQEDNTGPVIELYINDTTFTSGSVTTAKPVLIARLFDESGINTVGNGIGHDIMAILDGNTQMPIILNDYYTPDPDTYQSGWVNFPLGRIAPGEHQIYFRAWDICNNSSDATITFVIDTVSPLRLTSVYNYPNPFREGTHFVFKHNKPGNGFEVRIEIFSIDGRYVNSLEYSFTSENVESIPMYWDGRDFSGNLLSSGVYIYNVIANAQQGKFARVTQKFIYIR